MNTVGVLEAYVSTHQLAAYDTSTTSWIFSIYIFLAFFGGVQIGPIFDAKGPRLLVLAGSVLLVGSTMALASCTGERFSHPLRQPSPTSNRVLAFHHFLLHLWWSCHLLDIHARDIIHRAFLLPQARCRHWPR